MEFNAVLSMYTGYSRKASQVRRYLSRDEMQREGGMNRGEECCRKNKEEQTQNPGGVMFLERGRKVKTASMAGKKSRVEDEAVDISRVGCLRHGNDFGFYSEWGGNSVEDYEQSIKCYSIITSQ